MKSRVRGVAVLFLAAVVLSASLVVAKEFEPLVVVREFADLDGDGRQEQIRVAFYGAWGYWYDRAVVEINTAVFVLRGESLVPVIHVTDIDAGDPWREIAISQYGPSDDYETYFLRFAAETISPLGSVPGFWEREVVVDGSGRVRGRCRGAVLQTWFDPCEYALSAALARLEKVHENWFPMNTPVTLKVDLSVQLAPNDPRPAGVIRTGERATIVRSDDERWCYIESDGGIKGYFGLIGFSTIGSNGLPASKVFEGMCSADRRRVDWSLSACGNLFAGHLQAPTGIARATD